MPLSHFLEKMFLTMLHCLVYVQVHPKSTEVKPQSKKKVILVLLNEATNVMAHKGCWW